MCKIDTWCYGLYEENLIFSCLYFYMSGNNDHCSHPKGMFSLKRKNGLIPAPDNCPRKKEFYKDDLGEPWKEIESFSLDITPAFQIPWPLRDLEMSLLGNEIKLTHNQIIDAIGQATNNIIRKHSKEYDEDFTKIKAKMLKKIYYALKIGGVDDLKIDGEKIIIPKKP